MDVSLSQAANAYASRMQQGAGDGEEDAGVAAAGGPSFSNLLGQALDSVATSGNKAEALEMQSAGGANVNLTDLVTAVANAELSLNTVVAIRDRVISAYQSIIGMPI